MNGTKAKESGENWLSRHLGAEPRGTGHKSLSSEEQGCC